MPAGAACKDIDELLRQPEGAAALDEREAAARDGFAVLLDAELDGCKGPQDMAAAVGRVLPVIADNPDALARDLMLQQLAKRTRLGIHKLRRQLAQQAKADEGEGQKGPRHGTADDWLSLDVARAFLSTLNPARAAPAGNDRGNRLPPDPLGDEAGALVYHRDSFARFDGRAYVPVADGEMQALVGRYVQREEHGKPTTSFVNNVLGNLRSLCVAPYDLEPPVWLRGAPAGNIAAEADGDGHAGSAATGPVRSPRRKGQTAGRVMCLQNGLLDLDAWLAKSAGESEGPVLFPHTSDLFTFNYLPFRYDPAGECPKWADFLATVLPDVQSRNVLMEWIGYCLLPTQSMQKMLIMVGDGANGKSVVCDVLERIVGGRNCSAQPLENIHEGFNLAPLCGKLINFSSELSRLSSGAEGIVKAIVGGDKLTINQKNKPQFEATLTARLVVTTNAMPRVSDRSSGMWRRMIFLPFPVQIPEEQQRDKGALVGDLCAELPGILNWALSSLQRLLARGRFEETAQSKLVKEDQKLRSNSALAFAEEELDAVDNPNAWELKTHVYERYREWCKAEGIQHPFSAREFGRAVVDWLRGRLPAVDPEAFMGQNRSDGKRQYSYRYLRLAGGDDYGVE